MISFLFFIGLFLLLILFFIGLFFLILFFLKLKRFESRITSLEKKFPTLGEPAKAEAPALVESHEGPQKKQEIPAEEERPIVPEEKPGKEISVGIPAPAMETAPAPIASLRLAANGAPLQPADELARGFIDKELWKKIEIKFAENWTGIIGALVMVMGVGFLGVYAALALKPFHRFLMISGFAAFLSIISFYLQSKKKLLNLAVWIRSSAGAIVLFAFLGSGWIPGLIWIEDFNAAMILLVLGIALNIYLGFIAGKQAFASFHIVISLIALGIAPQSLMTLVISTVVIFFGIAFSYRSRWEHHLLLTIIASLTFHYYWYDSMDFLSRQAIPFLLKATGISSVASIGVFACLVHYRRIYSAKEFDLLPFLGHMANWIYLIFGFLLYSVGSKWNTPVLAGAALVGFFLARKAMAINIRWLYIMDTLIAQSIALYAIYTLERWNFDSLSIVATLYAEILLFGFLMINQRESILQRAGIYLHLLSVTVVFIMGSRLIDWENVRGVTKNSLILAGIIGLQMWFHFYLRKTWPQQWTGPEKDARYADWSSGFFVGLLTLILFGFLHHYPWPGYLITALGVFLFYIRQRTQSMGLGHGLFLFLFFTHVIAWSHMGSRLEKDTGELVLYALPIFFLGFAWIAYSFFEEQNKFIRFPGIYLFSFHLIYFLYLIAHPVSPFLPGVYWLILSVIYLEMAKFLQKFSTDSDMGGSVERHLLHVGYGLIFLFILRHILVHMQSEMYVGTIKVRFLIEMFGVLVFLYWAMARVPERIKQYKGWLKLHPLFWELIVLSSIFILALEVSSKWHPLGWILMAFGLSAIGKLSPQTLSRFSVYGLVLYWTACFHVAFITGMQVTPSLRWAEQTWFVGGLAVGLQLGFVLFFYKKISLEYVEFPRAIKFLANLVKGIRKRRHLWVFYPFFIAVALYFYGNFDRSLLTLLWVFEAFAIFALSLTLRESHFRYLAMACLAGCLLRLILYDLSHSTTLTRAVVFLGVGLLMLMMNYLYNRYKERF